jgi:hypothetical protein
LEYELRIDSLDGYGEHTGRYNATTNKWEPVKWKISTGMDVSKPVWKYPPLEVKKTIIHYGCGPAIGVSFSCNVKEDSEYLVKTAVKDTKTGKEVIYYLVPDKNEVYIGHGMCSGAFEFREGNRDAFGKQYEVKFSLMDASGNITGWTDVISFTSPGGN